MKNLTQVLIDSELVVTDIIDYMLYENLFAPASLGVNKWCSIKDFMKKLSYSFGDSSSFYNEHYLVILYNIIKNRFAFNIAEIELNEIVVIEVGDKNQIELRQSKDFSFIDIRIIPSEV
ncbi:hypothetical protein CPTAKMNP4_174 [Salmonella phage vB_SenM-AKM_NP4]|uniref:Uncharacterized protein n=2 Tax=Gelderlandvirus TaxID=1913653 RepID=M1H988_BPS16|nr:hypothetical protein I133_gp098 [Salmonella phage vB_SenM-S16]YP_009126376.1 hypothetical protein STP4a_169 [Salmonella phage STP4-a]UFK27039.1 hypothetical protein LG358_00018 [Escherichia phage UoN_LG358_1]WDR21835.1 hypothetical protein PJM34_0167 [Salmonella phage vB_SenM_UTK0003]WLI71796.1 hypothetical protein CPTAKMNP4_174 [Salmonella phage vB_SenM-AKM_NP4]AGE48194.1 hypothetical protein [Salmonella phage vB_SenM-S16]AHJ87023.1 hypothetical protein STP4a_169 [Salmonella phage STP4-a]